MRWLPLTTFGPGSWHLSSSRFWETSWAKRNMMKMTAFQCSQHSSNRWKLGRAATKWGRALSHPPSPTVETTQGRRSQQSLDMWIGPCGIQVRLQGPARTGTFHITIQFLSGPLRRTALHCERTNCSKLSVTLFHTSFKPLTSRAWRWHAKPWLFVFVVDIS